MYKEREYGADGVASVYTLYTLCVHCGSKK